MSVCRNNYHELTAEEVSHIISFIPPDCDYDIWCKALMSVHDWCGGDNIGYNICKNWSARSSRYKPNELLGKWRSFKANGGINIGKLVQIAKNHDYKPGHNYNTNTHFSINEKSPAEIVEVSEEVLTRQKEAQEVKDQQFDDFIQKYTQISRPAPNNHLYLAKKRVKTHDLRTIDITATKNVMPGKDVLVVPMSSIITFNDSPLLVTQSLQFIYSDGSKRNYPGRAVTGCFYVFNGTTSEIYLVEGFSSGASLHEQTEATVVVCFSCTNMPNVAGNIRKLYPTQSYPNTEWVVAADNDEPGIRCGNKAANILAARLRYPVFPPGVPGKDFNDLHNYFIRSRHGRSCLKLLRKAALGVC